MIRPRLSEIRTMKRIPSFATPVMVVAELALLFLLVWRPTFEREIDTNEIGRQGPHGYVSSLDFSFPHGYVLGGDSMAEPARSGLQLTRDGSAIGTPHSMHADIRELGDGLYSHWNDVLYFSTPGNTDPAADNHTYAIRAKLELTFIAALLLGTTAVVLGASLAPALLRGLQSTAVQNSWFRKVAPHPSSRFFVGVRIAAASFVFVCTIASFTDNWREYVVSPDSSTYLGGGMRPPIMSIWIEFFSDTDRVGEKLATLAAENQYNHPQEGTTNDPIVAPIQAQRVFLALSLAILTFSLSCIISTASALTVAWVIIGSNAHSVTTALTSVILATFVIQLLANLALRTRPGDITAPRFRLLGVQSSHILIRVAVIALAIFCFVGPLRSNSFLSEQQTFLLSEPLAMCWQLLFAACMLSFIWTQRGSFLLGTAMFAGLAYSTRSASVFLFGILLCLLVLALWWDRRRLKGYVLSTVAVVAIVANSATVLAALRGDAAVSSAPMLNWGPLAFAIKVAKPGDEALLPDDKSRLWLHTALSMRAKVLSASPPPPYESENLGTYLYLIAMPAAREVFPNARPAEISESMGRVARPILLHRAHEYFAVVWDSVLVATGLHPTQRTTRLYSSELDWLTVALLVALTFIGPRRDVKVGIAAVLLLGMHVSHLCIVSAFDVPLTRYIHATEIFVVVALGLLLDHHIRAVVRGIGDGLQDTVGATSIQDEGSLKSRAR